MDKAEQLVVVGGIAADQWGLVTTQQAAEHGINAVQLKRLTDAGLLENVGRGVYLVAAAGYPEHLETKVAWLRLAPAKYGWQREPGDDDFGVVSHASACVVHRLGDIPAGVVDITVPRRRVTRAADVRLRIAKIEPHDITLVEGLPVTTPTRTIVDLLSVHTDAGHVGGVIADAEQRDLIDLDDLADRIAGRAKAYGLVSGADGRTLIEYLVAQAGTALKASAIEDAVGEAYSRGAKDQVALQELVRSLPAVYIDATAMAQLMQRLSASLAPVADRVHTQNLAGVEQVIRALNAAYAPIVEGIDTSVMERLARTLNTVYAPITPGIDVSRIGQAVRALGEKSALADEESRQRLDRLARSLPAGRDRKTRLVVRHELEAAASQKSPADDTASQHTPTATVARGDGPEDDGEAGTHSAK